MYNQDVASIVSTIKKLLDNVEHKPLPDNSVWDFDKYLEDQVISFCKKENLPFDAIVKYFSEKHSIFNVPLEFRCSFIVLTSYLVLCLKEKLEEQDPEHVEESLMSVCEEQEVRRCVEICVSLSLMGALLPGIGIPIDKRSKLISLVKSDQSNSVIESYDRLAFISNVLTELVSSNTVLKSIILSKHLGDYLSALFQLTYTPLLKPGCSNRDGTFTMTHELYARLLNERERFKAVLGQLQSSLNQTDLLKQVILMFGYCLQGGSKKHVWFTNACTKILNQTLTKSNGIEILLKAMCDDDHASPLVWKKLDVVARIIASMKCTYDVTCPQILEMLKYSDEVLESIEQLKLNHQFSIPTCKHFYQQNPAAFHHRIFSHIISPLENIERESGDSPDLTTCLIVLDRLFSHVDGLPRELLSKYANRLFFIYVHILDNPLFTAAKAPLERLLGTLLTSFSLNQCEALMNLLIFQVLGVQFIREEQHVLDEDDIDEVEPEKIGTCTNLLDGVLSFPPGSIRISSTGNISYVPPDKVQPVSENYEKYGQCVLRIMDKCRKQNSLFICLLHNYTRESFKDDLKRNVVNVTLLNYLVPLIQMEHFISDTPEHIIMLIQFLMKQSSQNNDPDPSTDNTDALCTGLTLLSILMGEHSKYKHCVHIAPSLESLINESNNEEVILLAKQCLEQIKASNVQYSRGNRIAESYEKAMNDACDSLLPVRAHGIATLTKLILGGDVHAKANMSALLCLFMENLSDSDSYVYLASVEGLAALAADHAETVVDTLTQHFISDTRQLECRLKLGEVLMKVARHLGEMLPAYKSHFLNAFLHGCKDEDHMLRASSLSNLAEVCRLLGYRIGSILGEIFICIRSIISSDPCPEPRRAAVMVTSYLLCGLGRDALQVLEPILPELYRTLRHLYETDSDDRTRLHAQLALEQLNESIKAFLIPSLPPGFATLQL